MSLSYVFNPYGASGSGIDLNFRNKNDTKKVSAPAEVIRTEYFDVGHSEPSLTLHTKGSHNGYGAKTIKVYGPVLWNNIPEKILKSTSISTFKMYLKSNFLELY